MKKFDARVEISHILQDHILNYAKAYLDFTACLLILKAFDDPITKTSINRAVNSEFNTIVRKASKCMDKMLMVDYSDTVDLLKQLRSDTYHTIIKTLKDERGIL